MPYRAQIVMGLFVFLLLWIVIGVESKTITPSGLRWGASFSVIIEIIGVQFSIIFSLRSFVS